MSSPHVGLPVRDGLSITDIGYDHPDAQRLIAEVQAEYVQRYGGPDSTPVDPREFAPPRGLFAVGYAGGEPVVMGGWRRHDDDDPETSWAAPSAEVKRMYVVSAMRGRGHARTMLAYLEDAARRDGVRWLLLETGHRQPEAVELYRSCDYLPVPGFGYYRGRELAIHLGKDLVTGATPPAAEGRPRSVRPGP